MLLTYMTKIAFENYGGEVDCVIGLDARGFLFAPTIASQLCCSFAPVRKKGKLPGECYSHTYEKEYGTDTLEIQKAVFKKKISKVLIVDDLLATGGTLKAVEQLVTDAGGQIVGHIVAIDLPALNGRKLLKFPVHNVLSF